MINFNKNVLIIFFPFLIAIIYGFENNRPDSLFRELYSNKGWDTIRSTDDFIYVKKKKIQGKKLVALSVEKDVTLLPHQITNVLMDVECYNKFLTAGPSSSLLDKNEYFLDGYQFIPVSLPFISDRKYCFRMTDKKTDIPREDFLVEWYLLMEEGRYKTFLQENNKDAIYIGFGAGVWRAELNPNNSYNLCYRLYMDPGGFIPNYFINMINENSILNIFKDVLAEVERRASN